MKSSRGRSYYEKTFRFVGCRTRQARGGVAPLSKLFLLKTQKKRGNCRRCCCGAPAAARIIVKDDLPASVGRLHDQGERGGRLRVLHNTAQGMDNFRRLNEHFNLGSCEFSSVSLIQAGFQVGFFFWRSILARKWLAKMTPKRQNENENFQTMANRDDS